VKKLLYVCVGLSFMLPFAAQATLLDDLDGIDGVGTGIAGFDATGLLVGDDFSGTVVGAGDFEFLATLGFFEFGGNDFLFIYVEALNLSGISDTVDFAVTFSSLDWAGPPAQILTGVLLESDAPYAAFPGAGLTPTIPDGQSLTLTFDNFFVDESRYLELQLVTEVDPGGGVSTPIPEPATLTLMGLGLLGLAARRRNARR